MQSKLPLENLPKLRKFSQYRSMKATDFFLLVVTSLAGFLWQAIDFTNQPAFAQATAPKRPVYVRDFLFDAQNLKLDEGLLGRREGPIGRLLQGLKPSEDPAAKAQQLVTLLSNTIVAELNNSGIRASRLEPGAFTPQDGLLVGGEFLEVDEGNRMRRAMVGFGAGSEEIKVQVEVYDLAQNPSTPFLVYGAGEEGARVPEPSRSGTLTQRRRVTCFRGGRRRRTS
jgi:Domain of unknown function (DUF4410)